MSNMATREAYGLALARIVKENDDVVVLDADLSPATKTCYAKEARPDRFINAGIAESNMVGMAAGMAASHMKPFASSFAMFLAGRAFEQIRNSIAYPHLNVKLCATHAGITVGEDGATHQCNEDLALMRALPGMTVLQPCDAVETREMLNYLVNYNHPCYVRMSRLGVDSIYDENYKFELGKISTIIQGKSIAFIASGIMVSEALIAIEQLNQEGIYPSLYNVHTIKPIDQDKINSIAKSYDYVMTLEEHNVIGGLFSAVVEALKIPKIIYPIGIKDTFGESGTPEALMKKYEIHYTNIIDYTKEIMGHE